jgi:hypothetical protein
VIASDLQSKILINSILKHNIAVLLSKKSMANYGYKQQYGVIVICKDEKEQREMYEMLQKLGLTLKVVTV